jgi:putative tricarboxylic transport membrane protein
MSASQSKRLVRPKSARAMLMAKGDPTVFVTRPIGLAFMMVTASIAAVMVAPVMKKRRGEITG